MIKGFKSVARWALEAMETLVSASAVAVAVENGRRPLPTDLRRLGIDAAAFGAIGRV